MEASEWDLNEANIEARVRQIVALLYNGGFIVTVQTAPRDATHPAMGDIVFDIQVRKVHKNA